MTLSTVCIEGPMMNIFGMTIDTIHFLGFRTKFSLVVTGFPLRVTIFALLAKTFFMDFIIVILVTGITGFFGLLFFKRQRIMAFTAGVAAAAINMAISALLTIVTLVTRFIIR